MASLGNPKVWVPYMNNKDCSQGFCSFYCPQWCYVIYPPPPPSLFEFPKENSSPNFSPLVIAILGIFASAFLLVTYYTLISKYCGNRESSQSQPTLHEVNIALEDNHNHTNPSLHHEPWHVSTNGLDEALIKSITVCKYKKGDGLVELTDCSVCLSEFEDGESVRLLPKCNHAFHVPCIDTWLKSHSSCPLCRASIFTLNSTTTSVSANLQVTEIPSRNEISLENQQHSDDSVADSELAAVEEVQKNALRAFSDLGNLRGRHGVIEIRDNEEYESIQRSVSMDHCYQSGLLIADVLHMNEEENEIDSHVECSSSGVGSSKRSRGESSTSKSSYRRKVLHCVLSPISMERSFSSGRIGRGRQGVLPI